MPTRASDAHAPHYYVDGNALASKDFVTTHPNPPPSPSTATQRMAHTRPGVLPVSAIFPSCMSIGTSTSRVRPKYRGCRQSPISSSRILRSAPRHHSPLVSVCLPVAVSCRGGGPLDVPVRPNLIHLREERTRPGARHIAREVGPNARVHLRTMPEIEISVAVPGAQGSRGMGVGGPLGFGFIVRFIKASAPRRCKAGRRAGPCS